MAEFFSMFLWLIVGFPVISLLYRRRLSGKAKQDYAYFVELKEFPIARIVSLKAAASLVAGSVTVLGTFSFLTLAVAAVVFEVCTTLLEAAILIGRPHPTRNYHPSRTACEPCRAHEDDGCTNVRMLDGFETNFKSREGLHRPVCCCGVRIKAWRELAV